MRDPHVSDPKSGKARVAKLEDPAPPKGKARNHDGFYRCLF
jgi:hypothetical protein